MSWEGRELIAVQDELGEGPAFNDITRQSLQLVTLDVEALQMWHSPYLCNITGFCGRHTKGKGSAAPGGVCDVVCVINSIYYCSSLPSGR